MLKEIEQLLILQDRDRKIRALRQELKNAPLERKQLDEKLSSTQGKLDAIKLKAKEVEVERKGLENDAGSKRTQIAKYQAQKMQTRKNEEFSALSTAIQHLEDDIAKIEDRELELMESTEQLSPQVREAEAAAQAAKTLVARQHADLDVKVAAVEAQIKVVEAERAAQAAGIEEELLETYDRLFQTKNLAVVALEHEVCTGCNMKVTASTAARTKGGREVVQCEQCNRILYRGE